MIHRYHAVTLDHSMVGWQVFLREGGVVGRRISELLAHELRHPLILVAAACDPGDDERHGWSVRCEVS